MMKRTLIVAAIAATLLPSPASAEEWDGKTTFTLLLLKCTKEWVCATSSAMGPTRGLTAQQCAEILRPDDLNVPLEGGGQIVGLCIGEQDATTRWLVDQLIKHEVW